MFVKIMFPLAFSQLWPYFEISDFAKVENIVKNIEELVVTRCVCVYIHICF